MNVKQNKETLYNQGISKHTVGDCVSIGSHNGILIYSSPHGPSPTGSHRPASPSEDVLGVDFPIRRLASMGFLSSTRTKFWSSSCILFTHAHILTCRPTIGSEKPYARYSGWTVRSTTASGSRTPHGYHCMHAASNKLSVLSTSQGIQVTQGQAPLRPPDRSSSGS